MNKTVFALLLASLAAAGQAQETGSNVEKCSKKLGVLAIAEPQQGWHHISRYGLGSPASLLRMMAQQSGCFDVVERGQGMQSIQQERALAAGGELRADSNIGQGQMQAADFVMTPSIQIGASDTGGIGGFLGGRLGLLGAIAGGLKFKEASTSILISDVRSSIQVAAAEGKASKTDFSIGGWGYGGGVVGGLGGYTSTPEGKVVAASFLDNYNKIVQTIRDQPTLVRTSSAAGEANAAASTKAEAPQQAGQMLAAKISNVKAYAEPSRDSAVVATLNRSDELVATGEVKNGFVKVDAANFSGWVQRTLVGPAVSGGVAQPAPAQVMAPAPVVAPSGGRWGQYRLNFTGSEQGEFYVNVSDRGVVTGQGHSATLGSFTVRGQVDDSGAINLGAIASRGMAMFVGQLDPRTGTMSGNWTVGDPRTGAPSASGGSGSFTGRRQ
ncbi:CsgG/HfaB family protein [Roseateles sp. LKC17W]|uniref:CsgG/HfaB family protein n=1 Tax=Pelomonas margarita TaxID=3299031 RepID=A0ABW7FEW7_9BURK